MLILKNLILFISLVCIYSLVQAQPQNPWDIFADMQNRQTQCASHVDETANISTITDKIHIFGVWKGERNGDKITATLGRDTAGKYKAKADIEGGSSYGPFNIKICDEDGTFYGVILGYKARFVVLSRTKMRIYSPLDENDSVELTRQ